MPADNSQEATALLTEHLQYTPLSLLDDIINSVNTYIFQGINSLEAGLTSIPPERLGFRATQKRKDEQEQQEYSDAKQEIEEGLHKLETLLNSTVDKTFDKFEIYVLRNILAVPSGLTQWIRLCHYEGILHPPSKNVPSPDDIKLLRRKLAASRDISRTLDLEYRHNEAILTQLRGMLDSKADNHEEANLRFMNEIASIPSFSGHNPLATNIQFSLSQLPTLKSAVNDLRSRLSGLGEDGPGADTAKDELRKERRHYIEQRTKSHIERNGYHSTTKSRPLIGKQTNMAEVEALEDVANIFKHPR